jgi:hypothetical protein
MSLITSFDALEIAPAPSRGTTFLRQPTRVLYAVGLTGAGSVARQY